MSDTSAHVLRELNELRCQLDRIDDAIHDLLIERANVVSSVATLRAHGKAALRPGREASIIGRLLARNHGALPAAAVPRIWREILASSLAMQTDFVIAITAPDLAPLAREHFGCLTPVEEFPSSAAALAQLRGGSLTAVLLPWPAPLDPNLLEGLFVVARIPFWVDRAAGTPLGEALVIGTDSPDPSGRDRSMVAIPAATGYRIAEIEGFLEPDDPRIAALGAGAILLGAYAVPLLGESS